MRFRKCHDQRLDRPVPNRLGFFRVKNNLRQHGNGRLRFWTEFMQSSHYAISYLIGLDLSAGLSNQPTASLAAMPMWLQLHRPTDAHQIRLLVLQDFHQQRYGCRVGFSKSFRGGTDDFWHFKGLDQQPPSPSSPKVTRDAACRCAVRRLPGHVGKHLTQTRQIRTRRLR